MKCQNKVILHFSKMCKKIGRILSMQEKLFVCGQIYQRMECFLYESKNLLDFYRFFQDFHEWSNFTNYSFLVTPISLVNPHNVEKIISVFRDPLVPYKYPQRCSYIFYRFICRAKRVHRVSDKYRVKAINMSSSFSYSVWKYTFLVH